MDKLKIFLDGELKQEIVLLRQARIILGRSGSQCDVCLDDKAVSRQHLSLIRGDSGYYAKDLGSTNGTLLNGQRIRSQLLQHGDVLRVGSHELKFFREQDPAPPEVESKPKKQGGATSPQRMYRGAASHGASSDQPEEDHLEPGQAGVRFLTGPDAGKLSVLKESLFTIGRAHDQMATIARRPGGYYLIHVGGKSFPKVNGEEVQSGGVVLQGGDVIEVGEHQLAFLESRRS